MTTEPLVHAVLPLSRAALCLDDETVFSIAEGQCPRCGTQAWVLLGRWLSEKAAR